MKKVFVLTIITALLITGVSITVLSQKTPEKPQYVAQTEDIPLNADTIFNLVNAEREKAGVKPLVRDARLDATAQTRSDDMVARNYYGHYDPTTGENLVLIKPKITECKYASENINAALTNEEAVTEWMNSKPHHDAILDQQYDISGIGLAWQGDYYIVTQHFCNLK